MLKSERQDKIVSNCNKHGSITISEIARDLKVSEMTIRRDLVDLAQAGRIRRVHGGAQSVMGNRGLNVPREFSHDEKRLLRKAEKHYIAKLACSLIEKNTTIFLGTGTTIEAITMLLPRMPLRIITNSLPVFNLLEQRGDFDLCLIGGLYRPHTGAFVGPVAEDAISVLGIDQAFIGANGIFMGAISTSNMEEGKLQQLVYMKADERYLLTDSSKIGKRDFYTFHHLADIDAVVTDTTLGAEQHRQLAEHTRVISQPPKTTGRHSL